MTLEDPFFVVKDEVCKALNKTRGLYQRWGELREERGGGGLTSGVIVGKEDIEWTNTELRNALRSIEWDLEDLEETIGIVERNPRKFKIDSRELATRRGFIEETKREVQLMKDRINEGKKIDLAKQNSTADESPLKMPHVMTASGQNTRYSKLVNESESPNGDFIEHTLMQQQMIMHQQDDQLDQLSSSMGNLKTMSRQIGSEVDEQVIMLDEFASEMDHTQGKIENTISKMARLMHLTNDKRQWGVIGALTAILVVVIIMFFVL